MHKHTHASKRARTHTHTHTHTHTYTHIHTHVQLVDYVWPAMMDALGKEPDADVQGTMMESICEIVELVSRVQGSLSHVRGPMIVSICEIVGLVSCRDADVQGTMGRVLGNMSCVRGTFIGEHMRDCGAAEL